MTTLIKAGLLKKLLLLSPLYFRLVISYVPIIKKKKKKSNWTLVILDIGQW